MTDIQNLDDLSHYITCLHEAGHAVAVLRSTLWDLNDPAVRFPHVNTGHLARAHFGRKNPTPVMTAEQAREMAVIGYAGYFAQNLIDNSAVLTHKAAGCEDDFEEVPKRLNEADIAHEQQALWNQSQKLVEEDEAYIFTVADVIYGNSRTDVSKPAIARILSLNRDGTPKTPNPGTQPDSKPEPEPMPDPEPVRPKQPGGIFGWLKRLFGKA